MRHRLDSEIHIAAPPAIVWEILTDLDAYEDWNPHILGSSGTVAVGERLTNRMHRGGGKTTTFRPTVTEVEPERVFEWLGRLGIPGIFDGRHRFELHPTETGTRFVQQEFFSGILVRPLRKSLDTGTLGGFEAVNQAIKERAEARVTG